MMPKTHGCSAEDQAKFAQMSDEALEEILRLDAQNTEGDAMDIDTILYITEVLAARKKGKEETHTNAEAALQSFRENYFPLTESKENNPAIKIVPSKKKRKHWLSRTTAVAAVLAVVLCAGSVLTVVGSHPMESFASWTKEIFSFLQITPGDEEFSVPSYSHSLASLLEVAEEYNIPISFLPMWLPDEYDAYDIRVWETPNSNTVTGIYQNSDAQELKIVIKVYLDSHIQQLEKTEDLFEVYSHSGIDFYIYDNFDLYQVSWMEQNCEFYLAGEISLDQLYEILDSINMEE